MICAGGGVIVMTERQRSEVVQMREPATMSDSDFEREKAYQITMSLVRQLKNQGAVTDEEYRKIDTIMLEKYRPFLGTLLSGKPLT